MLPQIKQVWGSEAQLQQSSLKLRIFRYILISAFLVNALEPNRKEEAFWYIHNDK